MPSRYKRVTIMAQAPDQPPHAPCTHIRLHKLGGPYWPPGACGPQP
jgi:hypothetical protein